MAPPTAWPTRPPAYIALPTAIRPALDESEMVESQLRPAMPPTRFVMVDDGDRTFLISASARLFTMRELAFVPAIPPMLTVLSLPVIEPWKRAPSITPALFSPTRPPATL